MACRVNFYPEPVPAVLLELPESSAGATRETLKAMVRLVDKWKTDTGIRELAQTLTRPLPSKAFTEELRVLQAFVRDRIRYVRDVRNVETLQWPDYTLRVGSGDCDDKAILIASLAESIGFATRFRAVGLNGSQYKHVFAEAKDPTTGKWTALECIVDGAGLGWFPPGVTRAMFAHVH